LQLVLFVTLEHQATTSNNASSFFKYRFKMFTFQAYHFKPKHLLLIYKSPSHCISKARPAAAVAAARTLWAPPMHAKSHDSFSGSVISMGPLFGWYENLFASAFWHVSMVTSAPSTVLVEAPQQSPSSVLHGTRFLLSPFDRGLSHLESTFPLAAGMASFSLSAIRSLILSSFSSLVALAAKKASLKARY